MGNCSHFCNAADPEPLKAIEKIAEIEKEISLNLEDHENKKTTVDIKSIEKINSESNLLLATKKTIKKKAIYTNGSLHSASEDEYLEDQKSTSSHRTNDLHSFKQIKKPVLVVKSEVPSNDSQPDQPKPKPQKKPVKIVKRTSRESVYNKEIAPGVLYQGEMHKGQREGKGLQKWVDGTIYDGEWKNDKANGKGKLVHRGGDTYEGDWENDKANGYGTYMNPKGGNYQGFWLNDLQHGKGKEDWPDGSIYEGEFKLGLKHGKGRIVFPDGATYEGDFFENSIQGIGEYVWPDKKRFKGEWYQNKMHGKGEFDWECGKKYIGEFQNDRKHGLGKMLLNDGTRFYGFWKSDLKSGKGVTIDKEGRVIELGEWKEGVKLRSFDLNEEKGFEVLLNNFREDQKKKEGSDSM